MLINYLKIALRNLHRRKSYTLINVLGLTFGLTCCLLITLYIRHELSYDTFHKNADHVYRLVEDVTVGGTSTALATATGAAGAVLELEFPEVLRVVRFGGANMLVANGQKRFYENAIYFTDSTVFDVFTFPFMRGNPEKALSAPFSVVLTQETATRYFGAVDPVGQMLLIDNEYSFTVTGVLHDVPSNTHLPFDMLLSMATREAASPGWLQEWDWSAYTYVQLAPGNDAATLQEKLPMFVTRHTGNQRWEKDQHSLFLQPIKSIHLHSKRSGEPGMPGSLSNLYLFSCIAVFILLIACINFVNLTTAQAAGRSREIGMRKVIGGTRIQLVLQFLCESVLLSITASFLAIGLCDLLLPFFRVLAGIPDHFEIIVTPLDVTAYIVVVLVIGWLAGSYPAFLLSGFTTASVLNGYHKGSAHGNSLRRMLIILQFTISMVLVAGTITVFTQLRYLRQHDLGYHKDQVLVLDFGDDMEVQQKIEAIKQEFLRSPNIDSLTASSHVPGSKPGNVRVETVSSSGITHVADVSLMAADYDFISFYGITVAAGRKFSAHNASDATEAFMVNEAAATQLGFITPQEMIGKKLSLNGKEGTVIGVVNDFNYESLHKRIAPLMIRMRPKSLRYLSLDVSAEAIGSTLHELESKWTTLAPHRPFDFFFLDEHFDQQYRADKQFGELFGVFAFIAILLACLGLSGLTSFSVRERTKEIGIRKVLGASAVRVVVLLSRDLIRLVVIAMAIATPVGWYWMKIWLNGFAYRITIHPWMFVLSGGILLVIALLTVSFQSIKAAIANPVDTLRRE